VAGARSGTAGLLLTAGDGGVFALGGAKFRGSIAGTRLAMPVSGVAVNPTGNGYGGRRLLRFRPLGYQQAYGRDVFGA
jgi:hypothetical protein